MATKQQQRDLDNHSSQLDPQQDAYWQSRGYGERPDDWKEKSEDASDPIQKKD